MTCVADLMDRKREDEGRWGGPGHFRSLEDDNTDPGPGEVEDEERTERFQLPCDCHFLKIERKSLENNGHIGLSHLVCKKDVNRESTC